MGIEKSIQEHHMGNGSSWERSCAKNIVALAIDDGSGILLIENIYQDGGKGEKENERDY